MTPDTHRQAHDQIDAAAHNLTLSRAYRDRSHGKSALYRQMAIDALQGALSILISPANDTHEPTPPTDPVGARMEAA